MKVTNFIFLLSAFISLNSCGNRNPKADAYGNFEATEITISAQTTGQLLAFNIEEGNLIDKNSVVGYIDSTQLHLKIEQLEAQQQSTISQSNSVLSQIAVVDEQIASLEVERKRVLNLLNDKAIAPKQMDDIISQIKIKQKQIASIKAQNSPLTGQLKSIGIQIEQLEDQLSKCSIINPFMGVVTTKLAEKDELVTFGKPLYKIANLNDMILRVYVSETQLASIKTGKTVDVFLDSADSQKTYKGEVIWISSNSEFTPKIIQTKEERVNLVYALKIKVDNDGSIKIGMPAEVRFN